MCEKGARVHLKFVQYHSHDLFLALGRIRFVCK
jgi:hypothetical protein